MDQAMRFALLIKVVSKLRNHQWWFYVLPDSTSFINLWNEKEILYPLSNASYPFPQWINSETERHIEPSRWMFFQNLRVLISMFFDKDHFYYHVQVMDMAKEETIWNQSLAETNGAINRFRDKNSHRGLEPKGFQRIWNNSSHMFFALF